jgi:hypothetical protein
MKLHVIDKLAYFLGSTRLSAFHYEMFHGRASRHGVPYPHEPDAFLGNAVREPLELAVNGRRIPDVFSPSRNLVVCELLKAKLRGIRNIEFVSVTMRKVLDHPWSEGAFSFYDRGTPTEPIELWDILPDATHLRAAIGSYFELVTARNADAAARYPTAKQVLAPIGPTGYDDPVRITIAPAMVVDYPILGCRGATLMSDEVFHIFAPHVNWEYFLHGEIVL